MNMKWHFTTTGLHSIQRYIIGMVAGLVMANLWAANAQAHPFVDHADMDVPSQTVAMQLSLGSELEPAGDRRLFTRDLALGGQSARDLSLKSFVTFIYREPPMYGRDFLVNLDVFERELFASVSSVATRSDVADPGEPWLGAAGLPVAADVEPAPTPASRTSLPEPTTLMLVAVGMLGLILHRRRTNWSEH
ncbi:PEP-CTERM sorting domain-containing protein [Cellvibrio sp. ARAG 10.3]|uniref:PEP-CTERM sorting domain-containing protein n=1 Tax=Cellvibrio sp. ARAG 10.3 TaxID=3451358 RepID=UPI003F447623